MKCTQVWLACIAMLLVFVFLHHLLCTALKWSASVLLTIKKIKSKYLIFNSDIVAFEAAWFVFFILNFTSFFQQKTRSIFRHGNNDYTVAYLSSKYAEVISSYRCWLCWLQRRNCGAPGSTQEEDSSVCVPDRIVFFSFSLAADLHKLFEIFNIFYNANQWIDNKNNFNY